MEIEVNLDNKRLAVYLLIGIALLSTITAYAYQSGFSPSFVGHTSNEMQFNITYFNASQRCGVASYTTIPNSSGTTFCSIASRTDNTNSIVSNLECSVVRRSDGFWEFEVQGSCGSVDCGITCFRIT